MQGRHKAQMSIVATLLTECTLDQTGKLICDPCPQPKFVHVSEQNIYRFHQTLKQSLVLIPEILRTISLRDNLMKLKVSPFPKDFY